jgi:NhaP-type Na+/H+ or K+/H+ antiporter
LSELNIALATVGGLVLVIGLLSGLIRRSLLSEPPVALLVGVLTAVSCAGVGPRP